VVKSVESGHSKRDDQDELVRVIKLHKKVFQNPAGQELLDFLMLDNNMLTGTFEPDAHIMAFKEGQRSVIMSILERLDIPMHQVRKMIEGAKDAYAEEDEEQEEVDKKSFLDL
tara:strand:- start:4032 stop:4370 length:339 start_codon:yes stop_codon:yes gene_type:complete